jgi:hypothetical protein
MTTKNFLTLFAIVSITLGTVSCKKDTTDDTTAAEIETTFEATGNQAVADNLNQDDGEVMEEAAARNGVLGGLNGCGGILTSNWIGNCAVVTVTGAFPAKNIKIDFGTGCTFPAGVNGITRKGIINILLTDSLRALNSKATITFDNYYVNDYKREGTIVRTNTTQAGASTRSHNRTVTGGKITAPDGRFWLHTANLDITQTEGVATVCDIRDDVYTITGTRSTTNAQGKTRTSTTQTPLQKKVSCENIDQGILKIQGPNHFAILDFGNGTCDRLATISIDGRPARTILLR